MPLSVRAAGSIGRFGKASSFQTPGLVMADFSNQNLAGAQANVAVLYAVPPYAATNPLLSGDEIGYTATLAAASGGRVIASGQNQFATLGQAFVLQRAANGTIYLPAASTTVRLAVISAAAAGQALTNLSAAYDLSTSTAFWTALALTVPAERQIAPVGGTAVANVCQLFPGDLVVATLTSVGALNVTGNQLLVAAEIF